MEKVICPKCKGNGYKRALIEEGREEVITDCSTCNNQGSWTMYKNNNGKTKMVKGIK
mgnify:CR=1 FL=1